MTRLSVGSVLVLAMTTLSCAFAEGSGQPVPEDEAANANTNAATQAHDVAAPVDVTPEPELAAPAAPAAPDALDALDAETADPTIPPGAFPTVEALCVAQKLRVVPHLREAEAWLGTRDMNATLTPSCKRAPEALAQVRVSLRAPFHEVVAIRIETGHATEVRLVVRTDEGWHAAPRALMVELHDDPGCPSIVRDGRLREIRVESAGPVPALIVIDEASRGAGEETNDDDVAVFVSLSIELRRASACRLESRDGERARMTCDEPMVTRALRTRSQAATAPRTDVRFTTDYHLDARGRLVTNETYDDAKTWE